MLNFMWNGTDSDNSREKGVLLIGVLENNCSKNFLDLNFIFLVVLLRFCFRKVTQKSKFL